MTHSNVLPSLRKRLMTRLFEETTDVLDSEIFLTILDHEEEALHGLILHKPFEEGTLTKSRNKVDIALNVQMLGEADRETKRNVIHSCVVLFLLHLSEGDNLNAEYYLMKAVRLNLPFSECEFILRFLESLLLIGE